MGSTTPGPRSHHDDETALVGGNPKALRKESIPLLVLGVVSNLPVGSGEGGHLLGKARRQSWDVRAHPSMWPGMAFWCDVLLDFI